MADSPQLARVLGVGDLLWLYLVAIVNLNIVPVVAAEGYRTLELWGIAILCFFLPQGMAVIELAKRMPGEGGLYRWTKQSFGDFHGFLCGWCYWITNMFFVPTLLLYLSGILSYLHGGLGDNRAFFFTLTLALLWSTVIVNIRGLGAGKWINNIGGIGAVASAVVLMGLAAALWSRGFRLPAAADAGSLSHDAPWPTLGMMCLALVGLEIGPVMGDEIRNPDRTIRRGVLCGGVLCAAIYVGSTAALVASISPSNMKVVQGVMEAVDRMSGHLGVHWILLPLAVLMVASVAGTTSAWVSGSARILFVCGLDRYLPKALGRTHQRYGSPHMALTLFGLLTSTILGMSFIGATVKEAYVTLLDLSVALQMVSYVYVFLVLLRVAFSPSTGRASLPAVALRIGAPVGLAATLFGLVMAFVPSHQIGSIWLFELKMISAFLLFLGLARCLFAYYGKRGQTVVLEMLPRGGS